MTTDRAAAIASLLRDAEAAHGTYEADVLGGVYDEDWAAWYAAYLLDHGARDHLPEAASRGVAELAARLAQLAADYEREQPASPWPDVYAHRLAAG